MDNYQTAPGECVAEERLEDSRDSRLWPWSAHWRKGAPICQIAWGSILTLIQVLNVQVPLLFKQIVDTLNLDITQTSSAWVVAGSLVLGCAYKASQESRVIDHVLCRRSCSGWRNGLWRTSQCCFRKHWATGNPTSGTRNL